MDFNEAVDNFYSRADEFNRLLVQGSYSECLVAKKERDDAYDYAMSIAPEGYFTCPVDN